MDKEAPSTPQATLLQLRLLVGFLGERGQFAWWPTAFYEASSRLFLEPVFVKTAKLAQYHGMLEAARRVHDEHLNVGSYHLFRLPEEAEQDLHALLQTTPMDGMVQAKASATDRLARLSTANAAGKEGPYLIGKIGDVRSAAVLESLAASYSWAFAHGAKAYPYLVD